MIGIGRVSQPCAALFLVLSFVAATLASTPAAAQAMAEVVCRRWELPERLIIRQWEARGTLEIYFDLKPDEGGKFHGWASYQTTEKKVVGNVSGAIVGNAFYARVLWTYSGVAAIGRYQGLIRPYREVPAGVPQQGYVFEGSTYDEYNAGAQDTPYWGAERFRCADDALGPPPNVEAKTKRPDPPFNQEKNDNAALATIAAEQNTVKPQARVRVDGAPSATANLTICEKARVAKARNSPAAPGLEQQCLAGGGSMAEPVSAEKLAELAARGGAIAAADPLSAALRAQQTEAGQLGFDIGMAAAENQTAPGPGKQHIRDSLPSDQRPGYQAAVDFSLERNRNKELAAIGAAIALADGHIASARAADPNVFYQLGFDIATGIFGDPALGARGNTATGPGSLGIRDALSADGQRGFNAAVEYHLARSYVH